MKLSPELNGLIGIANKAGLLIMGFENTVHLIKKKKIEAVLITEDLGKNARLELLEQCKLHNVFIKPVGESADWMEKLRLKNRVIGFKKSPLTERIINCLGV